MNAHFRPPVNSEGRWVGVGTGARPSRKVRPVGLGRGRPDRRPARRPRASVKTSHRGTLCFFDVPNLPFLHTLRAHIEYVFVKKCSRPNVGSQRGTFCIGKRHKRPPAGPGAGDDRISSSTWDGTYTSSPVGCTAVLTVLPGLVDLVVAAAGRPSIGGSDVTSPAVYGPARDPEADRHRHRPSERGGGPDRSRGTQGGLTNRSRILGRGGPDMTLFIHQPRTADCRRRPHCEVLT